MRQDTELKLKYQNKLILKRQDQDKPQLATKDPQSIRQGQVQNPT